MKRDERGAAMYVCVQPKISAAWMTMNARAAQRARAVPCRDGHILLLVARDVHAFGWSVTVLISPAWRGAPAYFHHLNTIGFEWRVSATTTRVSRRID
jgi:hypothetical protein